MLERLEYRTLDAASGIVPNEYRMYGLPRECVDLAYRPSASELREMVEGLARHASTGE